MYGLEVEPNIALVNLYSATRRLSRSLYHNTCWASRSQCRIMIGRKAFFTSPVTQYRQKRLRTSMSNKRGCNEGLVSKQSFKDGTLSVSRLGRTIVDYTHLCCFCIFPNDWLMWDIMHYVSPWVLWNLFDYTGC